MVQNATYQMTGNMPAAASSRVVTLFRETKTKASLSQQDRISIDRWQDECAERGFRLIIHERLADDPPEVDSFLSVYLADEPFAHFGVARNGGHLMAWSSMSGDDLGRFDTMDSALTNLLDDHLYHQFDSKLHTLGEQIVGGGRDMDSLLERLVKHHSQ